MRQISCSKFKTCLKSSAKSSQPCMPPMTSRSLLKPPCFGKSSSGTGKVLPQAGRGTIGPYPHTLTWALAWTLSLRPQLPPPSVFPLFLDSPPGSPLSPCPSATPPAMGPLSSLSPPSASSQLYRMNGTGSALAGPATRTAACPPSMRSCRLRSCPSRYQGSLPHPPGPPSS